MKISAKFLVVFLIVGITFIGIGMFSLVQSRNALSVQAFNHLESVREMKKAQIEYFFAERQYHLQKLLDVVAILRQNAIQKLQSVQEHKKTQLEWYFKERLTDIEVLSKSDLIVKALNYFQSTPKIVGNTERTNIETLENPYDTELKRYKDAYRYNDVFLITKEGDIVYTATKMLRTGQNVWKHHLKNCHLAQGFQTGLKQIAIQDFEPCILADNQYRAIFTAPIVKSNEPIGVLALTLSATSINAIVHQRKGLGKTEEAYLVGASKGQISYRSDRLRKGKKTFVIGDEANGEDITKAFAGQAGTLVKMNERGSLELSSYTPLQIPGLNWALITQIGLEESITPKLKLEGEREDFFTRYIQQYGYYDLYLIHPNGQIFYTVKHEADYGTNILNGPYANSELSKIVKEVLQNQTFAISDYAPYAPSNHDPHLFVAQPVVNGEGKIELVVALQLSDEIMDKIMLERAGMGETGETYLVGSDKLMRSNSFLDYDHHSIKASFANPIEGKVETESIQKALQGKSGEHIIQNYQNHSVLSAYTPLTVGNTIWALVAEMTTEEAFAILRQLQWLLSIMVLLVSLTAIFLIHRFTQSLLMPLLQVNQHLKELAQGKLVDADDIKYQGKDEMAEIITSFRQLNNSIKSTIEQANTIAAGDYTRKVCLLSEQDQLGIALSEMTHTLDSQSRKLQRQQKILRQINEQLERRVIERTQQLAKANEEIMALNERLEAENVRMSAELDITRQLQQMVLPKEQELKNIKDLDIAGFMEPADEVGGDYYDVLQHNGSVKIGIGDVTGHGLASGVLMLMVQTAVRSLLHSGLEDASQFLNILNHTIYNNVQRMKTDKNLTLSLLDYQNGRLRLTGQHEEVLVVRQGGYIERIDTFDLGFMVGVEPDITEFVAQREIALQPGDGVVLYTDGITEARNVDKVQYGLEQLCKVISHNWHYSALEILQAAVADVRHHIGGQKVYDDITLLVIKQTATNKKENSEHDTNIW
jgi:serine phosphatase RsbU (regulator of sigma subunit)